MDKIVEIPLCNIQKDPNQPRKNFDEFKIKELAESIKVHGLLQPILVRPIGNDKFQLVQGERRFRACKILGLETIRAEVRKLDHKQILEFQIVENLQREDLNPIEEAEAFRRMIELLGYTHEKIGERVGKSREYVTNKLRLLNLPKDLRRGVARGSLSEGHARALLSLNDIQRQREVCRQISEKKLNVRETEELVKNLKEGNVSHETPVGAIIKVNELAVPQLVDGKEGVDVNELESALITDLKIIRRVRHG